MAACFLVSPTSATTNVMSNSTHNTNNNKVKREADDEVALICFIFIMPLFLLCFTQLLLKS